MKAHNKITYCFLILCLHNYHEISDVKKYIFLDFRSGKAPILVATDVAARGLGKLCKRL